MVVLQASLFAWHLLVPCPIRKHWVNLSWASFFWSPIPLCMLDIVVPNFVRLWQIMGSNNWARFLESIGICLVVCLLCHIKISRVLQVFAQVILLAVDYCRLLRCSTVYNVCYLRKRFVLYFKRSACIWHHWLILALQKVVQVLFVWISKN